MYLELGFRECSFSTSLASNTLPSKVAVPIYSHGAVYPACSTATHTWCQTGKSCQSDGDKMISHCDYNLHFPNYHEGELLMFIGHLGDIYL